MLLSNAAQECKSVLEVVQKTVLQMDYSSRRAESNGPILFYITFGDNRDIVVI